MFYDGIALIGKEIRLPEPGLRRAGGDTKRFSS
jgi:hypothetical protein